MEQISFDESPKIEAANEPHLACVLLLDTSGSMNNRIDQLNKAVNQFKDNVSMDELSRRRVDVAIVEFNSNVTVIQDFLPICDMRPVNLRASGTTEMGIAINKAIDLVKERNRFYNSLGTPCFKPWIFMITDGEPVCQDMSTFEEAKIRVREEQTKGERGKLKFITVGVGTFNESYLHDISKRVMHLDNEDFQGIFDWLSQSMVQVSVSSPANEAKLPPLPSTAHRLTPDRDVSDW